MIESSEKLDYAALRFLTILFLVLQVYLNWRQYIDDKSVFIYLHELLWSDQGMKLEFEFDLHNSS